MSSSSSSSSSDLAHSFTSLSRGPARSTFRPPRPVFLGQEERLKRGGVEALPASGLSMLAYCESLPQPNHRPLCQMLAR